jgi:hypothetical protein
MCKCNPQVRTPFCGAIGCEWPKEIKEGVLERNTLEHLESPDCWCEPTLIQAIDDEHDCEVWSHKGHEELNQ